MAETFLTCSRAALRPPRAERCRLRARAACGLTAGPRGATRHGLHAELRSQPRAPHTVTRVHPAFACDLSASGTASPAVVGIFAAADTGFRHANSPWGEHSDRWANYPPPAPIVDVGPWKGRRVDGFCDSLENPALLQRAGRRGGRGSE